MAYELYPTDLTDRAFIIQSKQRGATKSPNIPEGRCLMQYSALRKLTAASAAPKNH
jgi:hypothetical protein